MRYIHCLRQEKRSRGTFTCVHVYVCVCTCAFITYLFVCMCVCLSTMTHMWESEDNFRVSSLLPSCGFWGLSSGHRPGGIRLSHFTSPEIVFSDNFLCDAGWPQAHYMVELSMNSLSSCLDLPSARITHLYYDGQQRHHISEGYFLVLTQHNCPDVQDDITMQCVRVCTLVISDILHVFVWAIFKNPFY